jgi:hypothetical protein
LGNNYNMMAIHRRDNQQREVRFSALSRRRALGGALRMAPLGYAGVPLLRSAFNTDLKVYPPQHPYRLARSPLPHE